MIPKKEPVLPVNRKQRRNAEKKLKLSKFEKDKLSDFWDTIRGKPYLKAGTKVKLNYDKIISYSFWKNGNNFYKRFVEENKEKIFTLLNLRNLKEKAVVFGLQDEDGNIPDFTFHENDLIEVDDEGNPKVSENMGNNQNKR